MTTPSDADPDIGMRWHQLGGSWVGTIRNSGLSDDVMPQVSIDPLSVKGYIAYGRRSRDESVILIRVSKLALAKDSAVAWLIGQLHPWVPPPAPPALDLDVEELIPF